MNHMSSWREDVESFLDEIFSSVEVREVKIEESVRTGDFGD